MEKLTFTIDIKASATKTYNKMLGIDNKSSYEEWTKIFNPTSTFQGSWDKGSKMYFIGIDENGQKGGMVSEIEENLPNEFVSICHNGFFKWRHRDNYWTRCRKMGWWTRGLSFFRK